MKQFFRIIAAAALMCSATASHAAEEAPGKLEYTLGPKGLATLSYGGQNLFGYAWNGDLQPVNNTPQITNAGGVTAPVASQPTRSLEGDTLRSEYSWGVVTANYAMRKDGLAIALNVSNTSKTDTVQALELQVVEMVFPQVPQGRMLEAGMWGTGGGWGDLHRYPHVAAPGGGPQLILVRFDKGSFAFAADPGKASNVTLSVPFTTNPGIKTMYPFRVRFGAIKPGETASSTVSFRFGSRDATTEQLAGDVLAAYRKAYPYTVKWTDRRPVGALFLATSQAHPEKNPRGWFLNDATVDITTPEGLAKWRTRVLKYADDSLKVLKDIDAQGMILWDPEGEEFANATYYGDPRLTEKLAPETGFKGDAKLGAIDEFFKKFSDAGYRTGICIRPQEIRFTDGKPAQHESENPYNELLAKIEYAKKRWGCTLFYVDSTVDEKGALDAGIFQRLQKLHPEVLMFPENESLRYFAAAAPLNSFAHHSVTGTPASIREIYPEAFSGLLASARQEQYDTHRQALIEAVRRGDILIINAWYGGEHTEETKKIYAAAKAPAIATAP